MLRERPVVLAFLLGAFLATPVFAPAFAIEPDDLPWDVQDYIEKKKPGSIEDILEREGLRDPSESEIALPSQDQPDIVRNNGERRVDDDRLEPNIPREPPVEARTVPNDNTQTATPPAGAYIPSEQAVAARRLDPFEHPVLPSAVPPRTMQPSAVPADAAPVARPSPSQSETVREQAAPAAIPPSETAREREIAQPPPPPAVSPSAPERTHIARETEFGVPEAPPLAVPSSPVARATVAVNGKLYLPLKHYFETRGVVTLKDYDQADRTALAAFYDKQAGESLWLTKDGFNDAATNLIAEIQKANDWGLSSADYKVPGLAKIGTGAFHDDDLADSEIKLSLVAMEYARHARGDRIDNPAEQLSSYLDRKPQLVERPKLLEELAAASDKGAYLRSLHPKHDQFELLRQKLLALRSPQSGSEFESIPEGPKITPGKVHWQVHLVRQRLRIEMAASKADGSPMEEGYYDDALARAVIDYKTKNGIEPVNATITAALRKDLNKSDRIDERLLLANMEQWRWMPDDLGDTHIWVNIPEFLVRVKKGDTILLEERIVAGKQETQTPVFSNKLKTVVFQPSWNVPESIKVNEFLPSLRNGNNPIEKQGLVMQRNGRDVDAWDIDWSQQDIRNYHIFQPPGDSNVLGVVKFLFPNKHSVYLHDTPAKRLFNEKTRTFSHGCMRVRNPVQLAEVIMSVDKGWDKSQVGELINSGPADNDITLDRPLPVHVTYFTVWVADDGQVKTFADVYGHEQRIVLGLEGRWSEIAKTADHLAPAEPQAVSSSEDWDEIPERAMHRSRPTRYTYRQDSPVFRAPAPTYRQIQPKRKSPGLSDFLNGMFGN